MMLAEKNKPHGSGPVRVDMLGTVLYTPGWFRHYRFAFRVVSEVCISRQQVVHVFMSKGGWK